MSGWLPPGVTDKDIDDAAPQNEPDVEEEPRPDRSHLGEILVTHIFPPIPIRGFDYEARRSSYDLGMPLGHGATPEEAIQDLLEAEDMVYDD